MRGHQDLVWTCIGAVVCAVVSLLVPVDVISVIFLAPLALFLTGYAIIAGALPSWRPEPSLRATASLGTSLAVLALGELLLNYAGGLRPLPWEILLVLIVLGFSRRAAIARPWHDDDHLRVPLPRSGVVSTVLVALGLLAAGAGVALAFHPVDAPRAKGFSELWLDTGTSANLIRVGVGNQEHRALRYGIIARFEGAKTAIRHVELKPGERKVETLPVRGRTATGSIPVEVTLYREGIPNQPYREVNGFVPRRAADTGE
jgi:uncharacterized membrane protein